MEPAEKGFTKSGELNCKNSESSRDGTLNDSTRGDLEVCPVAKFANVRLAVSEE